VRAVKQQLCHSVEEVRLFVASLYSKGGDLKAVVKPVQSAGSDDVFLCKTLEEAEVHLMIMMAYIRCAHTFTNPS